MHIKTVLLLAALAYFLYTPLPSYLNDASLKVKLVLIMQQKLRFLPIIAEVLGFSSLHVMRSLWEPMKWTQSDVSDLQVLRTDASFDGVPVRVYTPKGRQSSSAAAGPAVFYIHGGGFMLFDVPMYDEFCTRLAAGLDAVVVSVEYRLAPEFQFPTAIDDCETAFRHLSEHAKAWNVDPSRIAVAGDSAGGNLAAALAIRMRDTPKKLQHPIKFQILIYPTLQTHNATTVSARLNAHDFLLAREIFAWRTVYLSGLTLPKELVDAGFSNIFELGASMLENNHTLASPRVAQRIDEILSAKLYDRIYTAEDLEKLPVVDDVRSSAASDEFSSKDKALSEYYEKFIFDPDYSPLMVPSTRNLPPAYIVVCEFDILRDDGLLYAERLKSEGVPVVVKRYQKYHPYALLEPKVPVDDIVAFVKPQKTS